MIELQPFEATDIPRLLGWIPDSRFLLQWSGPKYTFPLYAAQLRAPLEATKGKRPSHLMFKARLQPAGDTIGHIELMNIDYERSTALLGRVLIGEAEHRGRGYGKQLVEAALSYGFERTNLLTITLGVFDFNIRAIACYSALGFTEYARKPHARRFGEEYWTPILMRLERTTWDQTKACGHGRHTDPADPRPPRE